MRYHNLDPAHGRPGWAAVWRRCLIDRGWRRGSLLPPGPPAPQVLPNLERIHERSPEPRLTWIGHASVLWQIGGANVLIDPVFSPRVAWLYPRHAAPGLTPEQLPPIDLILVTHNHYDHLDAPSIAALPRSATVVVPAGLAAWFLPYGFARVVELRWWESCTPGGVQVTLVPARHWSQRGLLDTNATLWGGFVVQAGGVGLYHAGDSAVFDGFAEIGRRFPSLAAALLPIGGYAPQWFMQHNHFTPEQAGEAFLQTGAQRLIPIHWGTFQISDEPLCEPIERLRAWCDVHAITSRQRCELAIGETLPIRAGSATPDWP